MEPNLADRAADPVVRSRSTAVAGLRHAATSVCVSRIGDRPNACRVRTRGCRALDPADPCGAETGPRRLAYGAASYSKESNRCDHGCFVHLLDSADLRSA